MKNILLAIMGTNPQVLTETLYAIYMQGKPFPDEVYLVTTEDAKEKVVESLFLNGEIEKLKSHYNLPDFKFELNHILLMKGCDGVTVLDGREEKDQQRIADSIIRIVSRFTSDVNCRIHASISGGRKIMAFYLGYAMSIFAREQDILSHVFVSSDFEFSKNFFFPTLTDNYITHNGKKLNTKDAKVILTEIPFIRMQNIVDRCFLNRINNNSFSETIELINRYRNENINILIEFKNRRILVNDNEIKLSPKELAFYFWLSNLRDRQININREFCSDPSYSASYLKIYSKVSCDSRLFSSFNIDREVVESNTEQSLSKLPKLKPLEKEWVQQVRSKINAKFKSILETDIVNKIQINSYEYNTQLHKVCYSISKSLIIKHDLDLINLY